jgi:hypothetical protein
VSRRLRRRLWIALAVLVFLAISFELARWLSLENIERQDVTALLVAEAHGDRRAILSDLHDCTAICQADVRFNAAHLKQPGKVLILAYTSPTSYALSSTTGLTRVAWKSSREQIPTVQCVTVARRGNVISGLHIRLLRVSRPLHPTTADC